jgi:hypothetical protein
VRKLSGATRPSRANQEVFDHAVDDVAAAAGTISYEILTALGRRYHRVHLPATG